MGAQNFSFTLKYIFPKIGVLTQILHFWKRIFGQEKIVSDSGGGQLSPCRTHSATTPLVDECITSIGVISLNHWGLSNLQVSKSMNVLSCSSNTVSKVRFTEKN